MVYMYHSFLIHSYADGHLGCFHVLAIINSAAVNIGVHVSLSDLSLLLLFNTLSGLVIAFLPRNKRLLISLPQLPSVVILEPKKIKSVTVSILSLSVCQEMMGLNAMILIFLNVEF